MGGLEPPAPRYRNETSAADLHLDEKLLVQLERIELTFLACHASALPLSYNRNLAPEDWIEQPSHGLRFTLHRTPTAAG